MNTDIRRNIFCILMTSEVCVCAYNSWDIYMCVNMPVGHELRLGAVVAVHLKMVLEIL